MPARFWREGRPCGARLLIRDDDMLTRAAFMQGIREREDEAKFILPIVDVGHFCKSDPVGERPLRSGFIGWQVVLDAFRAKGRGLGQLILNALAEGGDAKNLYTGLALKPTRSSSVME